MSNGTERETDWSTLYLLYWQYYVPLKFVYLYGVNMMKYLKVLFYYFIEIVLFWDCFIVLSFKKWKEEIYWTFSIYHRSVIWVQDLDRSPWANLHDTIALELWGCWPNKLTCRGSNYATLLRLVSYTAEERHFLAPFINLFGKEGKEYFIDTVIMI